MAPAQPTLANPRATTVDTIDLSQHTAVAHKVHIRGVDDFTTDDLKAFAAEHHARDLPIRVEWIDDTSANIVYNVPAAAMGALESFSVPSFGRDAASMPHLQLRPAKSFSNRPESKLHVRTAVSTDLKRPRAHEASRFYMMHPEHDPREKARRQGDGGSENVVGRRRYGDGERRRRRLQVQEGSYKASIYDDDPESMVGNDSASRRSSISMRSIESDQGPRIRGARRGDFYRPESRSDPSGFRDRSASPGKSDGPHLTDDRRRTRQRTPPRNRDKELFPAKSFTTETSLSSIELFPNKSIAANLKKELFPAKTSSPHHRRSDAFDAADETADLFAAGMAFAEKKVGARSTPTTVSESSFGRLRSSDPDPQYEPEDTLDDTGMSIKGASKHQDTGVSIRGAAQKSHVGTIRELFPTKVGNAGKELFAEQLLNRSSRRKKAEDLFN